MKGYVLVMLMGLMILACASQAPATDTSSAQNTGGKVYSIEELSNQAQVLYNQSLKGKCSKEEAVQSVVKFLRAQTNVKDLRVTGTDTVRVFFKDGDDIILMLGRDRL